MLGSLVSHPEKFHERKAMWSIILKIQHRIWQVLIRSLVGLSMFCLSISMCVCLHANENMPINLQVAMSKSNYLLPSWSKAGVGWGAWRLVGRGSGPPVKTAGCSQEATPRALSPVLWRVMWVLPAFPSVCLWWKSCSQGGCEGTGVRTRDSPSHLSNCSIRMFHI